MKKLERNEVLSRVRFASKSYDSVNDVVYSGERQNINDFEIIRYDRKSWIEYTQIRENVYLVSLEDFKKKKYEDKIVIQVSDLMFLTNCGYGFLKG